MAQYALLLTHAPNRYHDLSENDYMAIIKDYVDWVEKLTADGIYKGGHKLVDEAGKILSNTGGSTEVHEGPYTELAEVLGGLMILEAESYDAVVEIAKTHPHLIHNSTLEIREIHDV